MKRFFALALALCLLLCGAALADNSNRQTELRATVQSGYTIVIPPTLNIAFGAERTNLPVQLTSLHLSGDYNALKLSIGSIEPLKNENGDVLRYTIDGAASTATRYFQNPETQSFVIGISAADWNKAPAGNYSHTLSFSVEFANKTGN